MKKIMKKIGLMSLLLAPVFAFADTDASSPTANLCNIKLSTLGNIIAWASCTLIKVVVPLLFTLAVVGFIWGIIQYYLNPENEEKRKAGKSFMLWGIIALFVMISMWGLVSVLTNTFGVKTLLPQLSQ